MEKLLKQMERLWYMYIKVDPRDHSTVVKERQILKTANMTCVTLNSNTAV